GDGPLVPNVDDLTVPETVVERGDELRRRLAVESPAPPLQEVRLAVQRGVRVQLEEPGLDVHDLLGPGGVGSLMLQDLPGEVVVAQVGGGKGTQGPNQLDRQIDRFG